METLGRFGHKSLPTYYKGITFRSRLEARWAIILDELGIAWEYEPEAIVIDSRHFPDPYNPETFGYLPDFYLPGYKAFMEVKGALDWPEYWKIMRITHQLVPNDYNAEHKFLLAGDVGDHDMAPVMHSLFNYKGSINKSRPILFKTQELFFGEPYGSAQIGDDTNPEESGLFLRGIEDINWELIKLGVFPRNKQISIMNAAKKARNTRFDRGHNV
jgi:hypothetical protein